MTWARNWSSAFHLEAAATKWEEHEEEEVFGFNSALSEIGGSLGLFLGWSLRGMLEYGLVVGKVIVQYGRMIGRQAKLN